MMNVMMSFYIVDKTDLLYIHYTFTAERKRVGLVCKNHSLRKWAENSHSLHTHKGKFTSIKGRL